MKLTFHGHSVFEINTGSHNLIIDPFLKGNPQADINPEDIKVDYIILSHAHSDHLGDTVEIAKKNDATIIAVNELSNMLTSKGCKAHFMHIGGCYNFPFGTVKLTIAHHGSSDNDGNYMGEPAGIIVGSKNKYVYHAGDTGLFLDMKLIGEMNKLDAVLLPIGDNFTMGIDDAVKSAEFLNSPLVIPMHYNTWDLIKADVHDFRRKIESIGKKCQIMKPGETIDI